MKKNWIISICLFCALSTSAQNIDPILLYVDNKPITRSEFEYSYYKNSGIDGAVEQKTIDEYKEEAYIEEHREIYLRGAILGDVQFARKIGWKFCGFEEISLAQEPKYGRITANSAMLFPNGVQVNKGAIFQCIKESLLI